MSPGRLLSRLLSTAAFAVLIVLAAQLLANIVFGAAARAPEHPGASHILLALLEKPLHRSSPRAVVQLRVVSPDGRQQQTLYQRFTAYSDSLDVSADRHWLAYTDMHFALHLIALTTGNDRVIGSGMWPQFSYDSRYLAFLRGDGFPIQMPGLQGHLAVYDLSTHLLSRVGPAAPLLSTFAWAPHADRLAWQIHLLRGGAVQQRPDPKGPLWMAIASAGQPKVVQFTRPPGENGDIVAPGKPVDVRNDGSPTWGTDGRSLLYWQWRSANVATGTNRWALMRWQLPRGPATTLATVDAAFPSDMVPPAPVVSPDGKVIVSLLGGPSRRFNEFTLYLPSQRRTRLVQLPGEPRSARFGAGSAQLAVTWDGPYNGTDVAVRHAALVNTATGSVTDLGPALTALYCP